LEDGQTKVTINPQSGHERNFVQEIHSNTGSKEIPAIFFGAFLDDQTKKQTYVTPLEPAREIFLDLIQIKSEADLTRVLHAFPQKIAYAPKCNHSDSELGHCTDGYYNGIEDEAHRCKSCAGRGVDVHTTVQDVIFVQLPNTKEQFLPLQDLIHYVNLPEWLPKWQYATLLVETLRRVSVAVFNTELFETPRIEKTALAKVIEYDNIYDTLKPQADKVSDIFKKIVRVTAQYIEADEGLIVYHSFPVDFKQKDVQTLIQEFAQAKQAGVSPESLRSIETDLLSKQYVDDPDTLEGIKIRQNFKPFSDKTLEEIFFILQGRDADDPDRILYENFAKIFFQISKEQETPFHLLNYVKQKEIIEEKVNQIREQIKSKQAPALLNPIIYDDEEQDEG
jgi:hypothetical protein